MASFIRDQVERVRSRIEDSRALRREASERRARIAKRGPSDPVGPGLIVSGCGRSGTSAVAAMLHRSGISVGHDLIPADEGNADGYYEERAIVRVNDLILAGTSLTAKFSNPGREEITAAAAAHLPLMRELAEDATPAWKDPRFSWTLEPWLGLFSRKPRLIVCLRSAGEVAASTMRYYGLVGEDEERAVIHTWRTEYERLLDVIESHGLTSMCVEFDRLHGEPVVAAAEIGAFAGRAITPDAMRADLRHHRAEVAGELRPLYERVRALGKGAPA
jgi:hypothetical protein